MQQAKRYGVLYNVLRDRNSKSDNSPVDIIARAEDASKIQRIVDRFELGKVDKASIVSEAEKDIADRKEAEIERPVKTKGQLIVEETVGKKNKETRSHSNPNAAKTDKNPPSRRSLDRKSTRSDKGKAKQPDKPSVREELERIKAQSDKSKGAERKIPEKKAEKKAPPKNGQTKHKQPKPKKKKSKER